MNKNFLIRSLIIIMILLGYIFTYYQPMWNFRFVAPQYPLGLVLDVFLTGAKGDVFEIDIINHYIGMDKLSNAAINERAIVPYILGAFGIFTSIIGLSSFKKKYLIVLSMPMILFPFSFVAIFFRWLYKFGHELNPNAPVDLTPFTPTIFGEGIIGQFKTIAYPGAGFYAACMCSLFLLLLIKIKPQL